MVDAVVRGMVVRCDGGCNLGTMFAGIGGINLYFYLAAIQSSYEKTSSKRLVLAFCRRVRFYRDRSFHNNYSGCAFGPMADQSGEMDRAPGHCICIIIS